MSNNRKNSNKTNKRNIKAGKKEKSAIDSVDEASKSKLYTNGGILDSSKSDNEKGNGLVKNQNKSNEMQTSNSKEKSEEDKSEEIDNQESSIYKILKKLVPIATALSPAILFFIKQFFISEKVSYYGIPSIYFNDIDLSSFLMFLLVSASITFILFYPTYRAKLIRGPQNKVTDNFIVVIWIFIYTIFIFSIYIGLKNIFISYDCAILIAFCIIITIVFFIYDFKLIKNRGQINKKISLALIFSPVIYFIIVALRIVYDHIIINDIVILIISVIISIFIGILVKSVIKKDDDNSKEYSTQDFDVLKNIYEDISTFISIILIFIFVINLDLFPQFKKEYEILNKDSNQCEAIITHYDGKAVVLSADIINNVQLILYANDYKLIDLENKKISVFNSKKPPALKQKRVIEMQKPVVDFINLRSFIFENRKIPVKLVDDDVYIYNNEVVSYNLGLNVNNN